MAEKESTDLLERYENFERWFDSSEVARFAFGERRRLRLTTLEIDLEYSFMDVALTGKVMAAVYMLSGLLPPPILLRQKPSWEGVDQAQAGMTGEIKVWPGRIVMDTLWFAITRVHLRKPKPRTPPDRVARTPELTEPK